MLDAAEVLAAYDQQLRCRVPDAAPPGVEFHRVGPLLRVVGRHQGFVEAPVDTGLRGAALDALIAEQRGFFAARGEGVEWKTRAHDLPADLPERLAAAGYAAQERETVLVALVEDVVTALAAAAPPPGVRIRRVSGPGTRTDVERVVALEEQVWHVDLPGRVDDLVGDLTASPDDVVLLVAEADGEEGPRVVSAARLVVEPGTDFAGLWGGSTLAPWRRRGIYRALVAERAREAARRSVRYLQVDASEDSRPVLERLGFRAITTTTPYVWEPPAS